MAFSVWTLTRITISRFSDGVGGKIEKCLTRQEGWAFRKGALGLPYLTFEEYTLHQKVAGLGGVKGFKGWSSSSRGGRTCSNSSTGPLTSSLALFLHVYVQHPLVYIRKKDPGT